MTMPTMAVRAGIYLAYALPVKGVYGRYTLRYKGTRRYLYATGLGNGFGHALALTLYALAVSEWVLVC